MIAFADMTVLAPGQHGYRGRAHSLWYADLEEEGRFAWYELAFMTNALMRQMPDVAPYACTPSEGALAIRPGVGTIQLAWTPTKLVPGELGEFFRPLGAVAVQRL